MNTLRNLWAKLTANGCKSDCHQGDRPCPTPELCYPTLHQHNGGASVDTYTTPEDMESIAWAVATVALALALGAPFVWFCWANWPLILMAFTS
jgi:hypothetical protein